MYTKRGEIENAACNILTHEQFRNEKLPFLLHSNIVVNIFPSRLGQMRLKLLEQIMAEGKAELSSAHFSALSLWFVCF